MDKNIDRYYTSPIKPAQRAAISVFQLAFPRGLAMVAHGARADFALQAALGRMVEAVARRKAELSGRDTAESSFVCVLDSALWLCDCCEVEDERDVVSRLLRALWEVVGQGQSVAA